ncbi:MAG: L,D-transpeptidase catalytic domain [Syntrophorhabdus sp. PtaB.Bin047]|nr:MAG: L,D-transpeptidase catalytic domain [Syntrophorhabdus sp. PtaB.Bin047]
MFRPARGGARCIVPGIVLLIALFFISMLQVNAGVVGESGEMTVGTVALSQTTKEALARQWPGTSHLILVRNSGPLPHNSTLYAFERNGGTWTLLFGPVPAMTGRNGFAGAGGKREGDGRTPVGIYPLGFVFGYPSAIGSAMPYRPMTPEDIWVDDPDSPDYNRLKKREETTARSFEDMVLADDRYKYGIVIEYNTNPVSPGLGSAIFLHIWKDQNTPTAGCVAISEENILKLIRWLDPAKKPLITIE